MAHCLLYVGIVSKCHEASRYLPTAASTTQMLFHGREKRYNLLM